MLRLYSVDDRRGDWVWVVGRGGWWWSFRGGEELLEC